MPGWRGQPLISHTEFLAVLAERPDLVMHARLSLADDETLCEKEGARPVDPTEGCLILDRITEANAGKKYVTCPACLEWLHA